MLWWDGTRGDMPELGDVLLPQSGVARIVGRAGQKPLVLAIKAGHNAEPHNHNDVGSFVLRASDGVVYLCDPGAGLYNAEYFSAKRYDNVFANSYGHSVPRIGGTLQLPGREHSGTLEQSGPKGRAYSF